MASGEAVTWSTPKHPGDAVRITYFERDGELGDVRIQQYAPDKVCVAMFLPGICNVSPGDTPKTEPEESCWPVISNADDCFDDYVTRALENGWTIKESGK